MSCPFGRESLDRIKQVVDVCAGNPSILSHPELDFFKQFIESLGGKIPAATAKMSAEAPNNAPAAPQEEESDPGSDLELDNSGCVTPDELTPDQTMGVPDKVVSEEDSDMSDAKRSEATTQLVEGNFEGAIKLYTEAIELNANSALLFAKRSQAYLKLTKPNACIKDCSRALELNPDSAPAYKFRGRAYRLLGEWEKAAKDLRQASIIDLDEQTDEWLKEVTPNAKKIEQHNLKLERKKLEKEEKEKLERARKAREAHAKAAQGGGAAEPPPSMSPGDASDFLKDLQDPEIRDAVNDPEVAAAFADIASNPSNIPKYTSNPKVMSSIRNLAGKFAKAGLGVENFLGTPWGPGSVPGGAAGPAPTSFVQPDDDNLD